jgi:hypothetical protein
MRSSKSRSRGNKNRNTNRPTGGSIINRVFDSSGPDGKVRGTPQQIIDKYNQLHRDAQLSNDRVAAENFAQHAEHYTRMLAEAQREVDRAREEQEQFNRDRQAERDRERNDRLKAQEDAAAGQQQAPASEAPQHRQQPQRQRAPSHGEGDQPDLIDPTETATADSGLVETPESQPKPRRPRGRKPKPAADNAADGGQAGDGPGDQAAAAE